MAVYSADEGQVTDMRWGSFVLLGLLAIVFGLLIAFFPQMTTLIMIELIGIFIVIVSFGAIMMSAVAPGGLKGSILLAILGIIGFFFGIATILSPYVMGKAIFILAGIALLIGGITWSGPCNFRKRDDTPRAVRTPGYPLDYTGLPDYRRSRHRCITSRPSPRYLFCCLGDSQRHYGFCCPECKKGVIL